MRKQSRTPLTSWFGVPLLLALLGGPGNATTSAKHCPGGTHNCEIELLSWSFGAVPTQTVRISVAIQPSGARSAHDRIAARFQLLDVRGRTLVSSEDAVVESERTVFWDVDRNALPEPGEPGTGRLQLRALLIVMLPQDTSHSDIPTILPSAEVIDNASGHTVSQTDWQFLVERATQPVGPAFLLPSSSFGLARGQTLRTSLPNPNDRPIRASLEVLDANGGSHALYRDIFVPAGATTAIDVSRDMLLVDGEPGTGRVQVRYRWFVVVDRTNSSNDPLLLPSGELLSSDTGETQIGMLLPAVQKIRDAK